MIKKLNFALVIVFAALVGVKMMSTSGGNPKPRAAAAAASAQQDEISALEPNVYLVHFPGYAEENRISNRNGYFADLVKAIFPRAKFTWFVSSDEMSAANVLKDPSAVLLFERNLNDSLSQCKVSESPLGWSRLCLMSSRKSGWVYDGTTNALKNVRVGCVESMNSPQFVDLLKAKGLASENLKIYPDNADFVTELEGKKIDAYLSIFSGRRQFTMSWEAWTLASCRSSDPLSKIYIHLLSTNLDAAFTEALLRDYEAGLKRIEASGERRRIAEYYGFDPKL